MKDADIPQNKNWYWIGAAALFGFVVLFNVLFTLALTYLNRELPSPCYWFPTIGCPMNDLTDLVGFNVTALGKPQAIISEEAAKEMEAERDESFNGGYGNRRDPMPRPLSAADGNNTSKQLRRVWKKKKKLTIQWLMVCRRMTRSKLSLLFFQGKWNSGG